MQRLLLGSFIAAFLSAPRLVPDRSTALQAWQRQISVTAIPRAGCFEASFPSTEWHEVSCADHTVTAAAVVGGGFDYAASTNLGSIVSASGSVATSGVSSVTDTGHGSNSYSLQLNTNQFITPACGTASNPSTCRGWEQYVYANRGPNTTSDIHIEYWLLNHNNPCPSGWQKYPYPAGPHCWFPGTHVALVPPQASVSTLNGMTLDAVMYNFTGPYLGAVTLTIGPNAYATGENDSALLGLGQSGGWKATEFNVLGTEASSRANFNAGSTVAIDLTIGMTVNSATVSCVMASSIGSQPSETNNLGLGQCQTTGNTIHFTESN